jgi:hypothetical protein
MDTVERASVQEPSPRYRKKEGVPTDTLKMTSIYGVQENGQGESGKKWKN